MKNLYLILILFLSTVYMSHSQGVDFSKPGDVENSGRFRNLQISGHAGGHLYSGNTLTYNRGKTSYFTRPSLRYDINEIIYAQVGLKTNGFAADWVEWGIGFRPFRC